MKYWIPLFGVPQVVHSDEGEVDATIVENMCRMLGIRKTRTMVYSPKSNGCNEAFNGTLGTLIRTGLQGQDVQDWHLIIPFVVNAYNNLVHSATGYAPAVLVFGKQISNHIIPLIPQTDPIISKSKYLQALRRGQALNWQITHSKLLREKRERNSKFSSHINRFEVGDFVLVKRKGAPAKSLLNGKKGTKHLMPYEGPYRVIKRTTSTLEVVLWKDDYDTCEKLGFKHQGPLIKVVKKFVSPDQCKPFVGNLMTTPVYSDTTINSFLQSLGYAGAAPAAAAATGQSTNKDMNHLRSRASRARRRPTIF